MEYLPLDQNYVSQVFLNLTQAQTDYYDFTPLILSEWGVPNNHPQFHPYPGDDSVVIQTYKVLRSFFTTMYFFQQPLLLPATQPPYGTTNWDLQSGQFVPTTHLSWYGELQNRVYPLP